MNERLHHGRVKRLAFKIETLPYWVEGTERPKEPFFGLGSIASWAWHFAKEEGESSLIGSIHDVASEWLGLDYLQRQALFYGSPDYATPPQAAWTLMNLAQTQEVVWRKCMNVQGIRKAGIKEFNSATRADIAAWLRDAMGEWIETGSLMAFSPFHEFFVDDREGCESLVEMACYFPDKIKDRFFYVLECLPWEESDRRPTLLN